MKKVWKAEKLNKLGWMFTQDVIIPNDVVTVVAGSIIFDWHDWNLVYASVSFLFQTDWRLTYYYQYLGLFIHVPKQWPCWLLLISPEPRCFPVDVWDYFNVPKRQNVIWVGPYKNNTVTIVARLVANASTQTSISPKFSPKIPISSASLYLNGSSIDSQIREHSP